MVSLTPTREALVKAVGLPRVKSKRSLHKKAAECSRKMQAIETAIKKIAPHVPGEVKAMPTVKDHDDLETNVNVWSERLTDSLYSNDVGKVRMDGDVAICTFYETKKKGGLLTNKLWRELHAHKVHKPRLRRPPYDFPIPQKGLDIIQELNACGLERHVRVLTGQLIGMHVETTKEWDERTKVGRGVDNSIAVAKSGADLIVRSTKAVGNGVVSVGSGALNGVAVGASALAGAAGVAAFGVANAAGAMLEAIPGTAASFVADPCIVVADTCFWGWID